MRIPMGMIPATVLFLAPCLAWADEPSPPAVPAGGGQAAEAAAETPAKTPGPKNAEFEKLAQEWRNLISTLLEIDQKHVAAGEKEKREIEQQYEKLVEQGEALRPRLDRAAEEAFAESPRANKDADGLVRANCAGYFMLGYYEEALRLCKLLIDHGEKHEGLYAFGGASAYCVGDLDTAVEYLNAAVKISRKGNEVLKTQKGDTLDELVAIFQHDPRRHKKAWEEEQKIRAAEAEADDLPRVRLKTTKGDIVLELFENEAPNTVANFISLVEKGFYNDLTFHRVLERFMAQGGCPEGTGMGGPGYKIPSEARKPNHRKHFRGSISMALGSAAGGPLHDSGGSQFFITFVPTPNLDGDYTVFGRVIEGMDVLHQLRRRNPDEAKETLPPPDQILEAKVLRKRDHEYTVKKTGE